MALNDMIRAKRTAYGLATGITTTASTFTLPTPPTGGAAPAAQARPTVSPKTGRIYIRPHETNGDIVYVAVEGTAVTTSEPVAPGAPERELHAPLTTISLLAASGTQQLHVRAEYA